MANYLSNQIESSATEKLILYMIVPTSLIFLLL